MNFDPAKWNRIFSTGQPGGSFFSSLNNYTGKSVTVDSALQLSSAWACIRLTSQITGSLPKNIYRTESDGGRKVVKSRTATILTETPNRFQTANEFWESMVAWMSTQGDAYAKIEKTGSLLSALIPLPNNQVTPIQNSQNGIEYQVNRFGKTETLQPEEILHLKFFDMGGIESLSPIRFGVNSLGRAMGTDEATSKLFLNGILSNLIIGSDKSLNAEQVDQIEEILKKFAGSGDAWKALLLPGGLKAEQVTMNPEDAEMLATQRFNVEDICRWWGVNPILIGHASEGVTAWGTGIEQLMIGWLTLGLNPLLRRVEARVNKQLNIPSGQFFEMNRDGILQMDSKARASFISSMVQNGINTRNEIRNRLNLSSQPGGDVLTVQSNLVPLEDLGNEENGERARNAILSWLKDDRNKGEDDD